MEELNIIQFENQENILNEIRQYRVQKVKEYQQLLLNKFQTTKEQQYKKHNNNFLKKSQHLYSISIDLILQATEEELILICIDWKGKLNDLFNECINKIN